MPATGSAVRGWRPRPAPPTTAPTRPAGGASSRPPPRARPPAAGNSVVLKPSELTPLSVLRLAELTADVLPPGVLNVVTGRGEAAGVALVEHPAVAMISLTGSVPTGQAIMRAAATTLKRVHLELGGKAPVVVLDDADPEVVAAAGRLRRVFHTPDE